MVVAFGGMVARSASGETKTPAVFGAMSGVAARLRGSWGAVVRKRRDTRPGVERLDVRTMPSVGMAYVGLSRAPVTEMSSMAGQFKSRTGEVEVSFLPFEFNPSNPFGNATTLVQETLPSLKGRLRLTVDLKWFVHSSGVNGKLEDGASASVHGRPAQQAFWAAWDADRPTAQQQRIRDDFLGRVKQADAWVAQVRNWAAARGLQNKLGVTFVPVLEDEYATVKAYTNIANAIRSRQAADGLAPTPLRRSKSKDNSPFFRISGVSMELHGKWSDVKGQLQSGDAWSNDGTTYGRIDDFTADGMAAKKAGVNVLYWKADMNGTPNKHGADWASRTVNVFSGASASNNKGELDKVLGIL